MFRNGRSRLTEPQPLVHAALDGREGLRDAPESTLAVIARAKPVANVFKARGKPRAWEAIAAVKLP